MNHEKYSYSISVITTNQLRITKVSSVDQVDNWQVVDRRFFARQLTAFWMMTGGSPHDESESSIRVWVEIWYTPNNWTVL